MNIFEQLNSINVNDHTEQKNGLTYLSWAWAWSEFKKRYPHSYYTIYESNSGINYFTDGKTCWVKTGVTLVDDQQSGEGHPPFVLELIEYLPVMDFKNKSILLDNITSFDVNKAIQRSLTKAVARHGLGLYIYAGEDLPEEPEDVKREKAAAAKRAKEIYLELDQILNAMLEKLSAEEKKQFFSKHVIPVVGQFNYKRCDNVEQLEQLLANIKSLKA